MAKRTATTELNHDNWDREDEAEEAGSFSRASEDALKKRVIKVAKRRNPISSMSQSEDGKSGAFGGFAGFGKAPATTTSSNTFGFLANLADKVGSPKTNGTEKQPETPEKNLDEYYAKLKGLNESVTEWIKKHVSSNPFINLQPIFKDYDKYFNDLEKMKSDLSQKSASIGSASTVTAPQFSFGASTTTSPLSKFSFGSTTTTTAPSTGFSFGSSTSTTASFGAGTTSSFSSGGSTPSDASGNKSLFSFGKPTTGETPKFSFTSTVVKPADNAKSEEATGEEEEDEPPKVEFKPVVEDGHIYTVRCKVFVKKDSSFADHGVGTLYLKPVPDSEKVQLIVRADTNLGRLLCNFILSSGIPMQRMGKKDVMLVCIPNPDMKPPPVPILLRVKSPEEADELLKTLVHVHVHY